MDVAPLQVGELGSGRLLFDLDFRLNLFDLLEMVTKVPIRKAIFVRVVGFGWVLC